MIDTREKRTSIMGVGRPWARSHQAALIDEQWRMNSGNTYGGNTLTPPLVTPANFVCIKDGAIAVPYAEGAIALPYATATFLPC